MPDRPVEPLRGDRQAIAHRLKEAAWHLHVPGMPGLTEAEALTLADAVLPLLQSETFEPLRGDTDRITEQINDRIDQWHATGPDEHPSLIAYLGWTEAEYKAWVEDASVIPPNPIRWPLRGDTDAIAQALDPWVHDEANNHAEALRFAVEAVQPFIDAARAEGYQRGQQDGILELQGDTAYDAIAESVDDPARDYHIGLHKGIKLGKAEGVVAERERIHAEIAALRFPLGFANAEDVKAAALAVLDVHPQEGEDGD